MLPRTFVGRRSAEGLRLSASASPTVATSARRNPAAWCRHQLKQPTPSRAVAQTSSIIIPATERRIPSAAPVRRASTAIAVARRSSEPVGAFTLLSDRQEATGEGASLLETLRSLTNSAWVLRGLTISTYMITVLQVYTFMVVTPGIVSDPTLGVNAAKVATLCGYCTMACVAGKLAYSATMSQVPPKTGLLLVNTASVIAMLNFCTSTSIERLTVSIVLMRFVQAGGWLAATNLMSKLVPDDRIPESVSWLGCASKMTAFVGTSILGAALLSGLDWRQLVFATSAVSAAVMIPFALLVPEDERQLHRIGGKHRPGTTPASTKDRQASRQTDAAKDSKAFKSFGSALLFFARSPVVWVSVLLRCMLQIIMEFQTFHSLFLTQTLEISTGAAAQITQFFHLGCVVALLMGGRAISRIDRQAQGNVFTVICVALALVFAALLHGILGATAHSVFLAAGLGASGLLLATPFFIPVTSFNLRFGGRYSAALEGLSETLAMSAAVGFDMVVAHQLAQGGGWGGVLMALAVTAAAAAVCMRIFYYARGRGCS